MSWATPYIEKLKCNKSVEFRPRGNSMQGKIESGQLVKIDPISESTKLSKGDIVLCKVNGRHFLHLIKAIQNNRFQIGNNKGFVNGWVSRDCIYGICVSVSN
jgi:phage repressor protein C with HTH and peptisase S24 domain